MFQWYWAVETERPVIMSYFVEMLWVPTINPIQSSQGKQEGRWVRTALPRVSPSVAQVLKLLFTKGMRLFSRQRHVQRLLIPFGRLFLRVWLLCLEQVSFLKGSPGAHPEILSYQLWLPDWRNSEGDTQLKAVLHLKTKI